MSNNQHKVWVAKKSVYFISELHLVSIQSSLTHTTEMFLWFSGI